MFGLDARVAGIAGDPDAQETLIRKYKPFILKCASDCSKRYITDSDDEWSIALQAFVEAIEKYHREEGAFLSFAKLVIRRRLYDYFDSNQKYSNEISVAPSIFSGENDEDDEGSEVYLQVRKRLTYEEEPNAADEIEAANAVFAKYGFSFFDLTACSPKAGKTKVSCTKAAVYLLKNPELISELRKTGQFPMKIVEKNVGIPRKILERHRKYIIAVVELLSGEYPFLADYLCPIREELDR